MTAAERIANSTSVTVAARVAMFVTPILVSIALFILSNYLSAQSKAMDAFATRVEAVEDASAAVATRVTTVETRIQMGQQQREKFQDQVLATLAVMQQQNLETQKAIARLEAKIQ